MKKYIAFLMIAVLSLTFCACAGTAPAPAEPTATPEPSAEPTPAPTPAPTPTPTPVPTPTSAPTPTPVPVPSINITKNPTGEKLTEGGKTWFIAHAENADSLTWQLKDTGGRTYSVPDAMNANPGLKLEVLDNDTIAVSNVPASLNGWSVEAVFSNAGGSVTTAPAEIRVEALPAAYAAVVEKYRNAYASGISEQGAYITGYSEMAAYSQHVGYTLIDLDGNGAKELIIAGTGSGNSSDNVIYEICTLSADQALTLCQSRSRSRYYLCNNGTVLNEGSSGAAYSNLIVMTVSGTNLLTAISLRSDLDENGQPVWYYYEASTMAGEEPVNIDQADIIINTLRSQVYVPQLTQII